MTPKVAFISSALTRRKHKPSYVTQRYKPSHLRTCTDTQTHFSCQLQFNHFSQALHSLSNQAYLSISLSISFSSLGGNFNCMCVYPLPLCLLWGSSVCTSWFCFHSDCDRTFSLQWWILNERSSHDDKQINSADSGDNFLLLSLKLSLSPVAIFSFHTSIRLHVNICITDGYASYIQNRAECQPVVKYQVMKKSIITGLSGEPSKLQMTGKWSLLMSQNVTCTAINNSNP